MTTPQLLERRAPDARASTWDAEAWSFEAVLATTAPVVRRDERGEYGEVLSLSQEWPASVPLLDNHRRGSVADRIGTVDRIRVEGGALVGRVVLLRTHPVAAQIAATVAAGQPQAVSIGGIVRSAFERTDPATRRRQVVVDRLELREVSAVLFGADPAAVSRGDEAMTTNADPAAEPTNPTPAAPPAAPEVTRAEQNGQIRELARSLGLPRTWTDGMIDAGATLEAARSAALDEMVKRSAAGTVATARVVHDPNDPTLMRSAMAEALAHRLAPGVVKLDEKSRAREYMTHRSLDMLGDLLVARGERINLRDTGALLERAVGAHSSSDFPLLLQDAANKVLLGAYAAAAPTYRQWAGRRTFTDFKPHRFLRLGDFPTFKEVTAENGEVRYGTMSENRETVTAKQFATGIVIGRPALINDDLGALGDWASMIATRAAADENARAYSLLVSNPVMSDSVALFNSAHGNKSASAGGIDATTVGAAVAAMRKQTSLDGIPLNLTPRFLVVGPDREMAARQLLTTVVATKSSDVNPWSGVAELIVDANITSTEWYLFADPAVAPVIVYGFLSASGEGPTTEAETDFDSRAVKIRASTDWGCGAVDTVGAYLNGA